MQGVVAEQETAAAFGVGVGGDGFGGLQGEGHAYRIVERAVRQEVVREFEVERGPKHGARVLE